MHLFSSVGANMNQIQGKFDIYATWARIAAFDPFSLWTQVATQLFYILNTISCKQILFPLLLERVGERRIKSTVYISSILTFVPFMESNQ
jgi:hypothetical protein